MNLSSIPSSLLTIQKFLSAFLDRLSKAKLSIETMNLTGKEMNDSRQLSTRIIQQWNLLFPNSPIHCVDMLSSNTLIATKTREEVILDRTTQQKLKLMMEVEVLHSHLQQQQQEASRLQEEITKHTHSINENKLTIDNLMQQRQNMQLTLSSLQSQKQQETTALQTLQSSKLSILEELVSLQQATTSQRTSLQALQNEKTEQMKKLEQMKNEQVLLEQSIALLHHQQHIIQNDQLTNTMTSKTITSEGSITPSTTDIDISLSSWSGYGKRKRRRRDYVTKEFFISKRSNENLFDDCFW